MLTAMFVAGQNLGVTMQFTELDTLSQNAIFFQSKSILAVKNKLLGRVDSSSRQAV